MPFYFFAWNDEIVDYLALHDVCQDDFEEIVQNPVSTQVSRSSGRPIAFGWSNGRFLACVYEFADEDTIVPVTAYEVDEE